VAPATTPAPCDGGDVEAYRAVLRAHFRLHRRAPQTLSTYHDAIRRDPTCARAYAGLALAYMFQAHNDAPPLEVFPLARAAADRALALDPDAPEALVAHGRYLQLHAWDWAGSERALRRALAINPSLADGHFGLAHLLVTTGRFDEGLSHARQARELDPLSPFYNAIEGGFLTAAGQPDAARKRLDRALELEPDFWIALLVRGGMALDRGDVAAAIRDLSRSAEVSGRASQVLAVLAIAHAGAGDAAAAAAILEELAARDRDGYLPATSLAAAHLAIGAPDAALDALERARSARDIRLVFMGVDARWNPLRESPRFRALARATGLSADPASGRF
jgi:Tfp pilus assembly protein PilF